MNDLTNNFRKLQAKPMPVCHHRTPDAQRNGGPPCNMISTLTELLVFVSAVFPNLYISAITELVGSMLFRHAITRALAEKCPR